MDLARPIAVAQDVSAELSAATVAHRDAQEVARKCSRRWRTAIVSALDAGMAQRDVAQVAGVSTARIHAVMVKEYTDA